MAGPSSKAARASRLQEQNKQAQQRYRDRRRRKLLEMEVQLASMPEQAQELQDALKRSVRQQVSMLANLPKGPLRMMSQGNAQPCLAQEHVLRLEHDLAASQQECQRLREQAAVPAESALAPAESAPAQPATGAVPASLPPVLSTVQLAELGLELQSSAVRLEALLEQQRLSVTGKPPQAAHGTMTCPLAKQSSWAHSALASAIT